MKKAVLFVVAVLMGIIVSASEVMTFNVGGDIDKYYPVVFKDVNWSSGSPTELEISRFSVHTDELWRGSLMASFKYHGTQWGHGSAFADAEIRNNVQRFIAGWRDATGGNGTLAFVIWLKGGNTSYYCKYANSNEVPAPIVYIGGYQEENGPLLTYIPESEVNSYVNSSGQTFGNNVSVAGNVAAMGNVGIGTTDPKAGLHIYGDKYTLYGPNSTWGEYLQVGGNGRETNRASVVASNGNLHIDAKDGNFATYINWHSKNNTVINGLGGNVGIGTAEPQAGLHIYGDKYTLYGPNSTWGEYLQVGGNGRETNRASVVASNGNLHIDAKDGNFATFINWHSKNNTVINGLGGNVGIGTSNPDAKLTIESSGEAGIQINSTDYVPLIRLKKGGIHKWGWLGEYPASGIMAFYSYDSQKYILALRNDGNVGIGTTTPEYKLSVNGTIGAKEVIVTQANWADFVFEPAYKLKTLPEVEAYIAANKRLPDMPSEAEVKEKGANIGDVQAKLLQKIEELTLYVIEQNKTNQEQSKTIEELKREISRIKENTK